MVTQWQNEIPRPYSLRGRSNSVHLDLGCGAIPRNPLSAEKVIGIDVFTNPAFRVVAGEVEYKQVIAGVRLPFETTQIDSVSAFDFLEHIPRTDRLQSGESVNPFVELMNEIYRILKPGGIFISLTPCFPSPAAFTDPTHVNFITDETHLYFSGPNFAKAKGYGFKGDFNVIEAAWSDWSGLLWASFAIKNSEKEIPKILKNKSKYQILRKNLKLKLRKKLIGHSGETHFLWVLQKPEYNN